MISINKKFLFVHIPKTGGNSLQNILHKYSEDELIISADHHDGKERFELSNNKYDIHKHSSINNYKEELEKKVFDSLFKFATIRNPWDLMISYYFSPHRKVQEWNREEFVEILKSVKTFTDYTTIKKKDNNSIKTILSKLFYKKKSILDFIIRFEYLNEDFSKLCELIDIPFEELPVRNKSKRKHYSFYYDSELIEMVRGKFSYEIKLGQYEF